jgi:hypothetical protein
MNSLHASAQTAMSPEQYNEADLYLHGRWLVLARVGYVMLVVLTLAIFIVDLPVFVSHLQTLCQGALCTPGQLTTETAQALHVLGLSVGSYTVLNIALLIASAFAGFAVSVVIFWRKSDDRMALLGAVLLLTVGVVGTGSLTRPLEDLVSAWRLPSQCLDFIADTAFFLFFLLFPNGRFVPHWTRWLLIVFLALVVPYVFFPELLSFTPIGLLVLSGFVFLPICLVVAQFYRFRYVSNPIQRQQTKWVVFGVIGGMVVVAAESVPALIFPSLRLPGSPYSLVFNLVLTFLTLFSPFYVGIAIMRYHLWDIDIIINRTLVYGTFTVILTVVYVGLVIGFSALLRGMISQDSGVALVLSTLVAFFIAQPLRKRLQAIIDRRFYRRKYDAAKTLEAFSATLRHEVDLSQLREHLLTVVQETMQPAKVSLWLRPPAHDGTHRALWRVNPPLSSQGNNQV